jgi:hypothetical protein
MVLPSCGDAPLMRASESTGTWRLNRPRGRRCAALWEPDRGVLGVSDARCVLRAVWSTHRSHTAIGPTLSPKPAMCSLALASQLRFAGSFRCHPRSAPALPVRLSSRALTGAAWGALLRAHHVGVETALSAPPNPTTLPKAAQRLLACRDSPATLLSQRSDGSAA